MARVTKEDGERVHGRDTVNIKCDGKHVIRIWKAWGPTALRINSQGDVSFTIDGGLGREERVYAAP